MKAKASATALKLINLYRQEHVIIGGWRALNPIFLNEATDDVLAEMQNLPNGRLLAQHIQNLRSGLTAPDAIERELLPYGGAMNDVVASVKLTNEQWHELESGIAKFTPDQNGLNSILGLNAVRKFGEEWQSAIRGALASNPDAQNKWEIVIKTYRAYQLWDMATDIINQPIDDRVRAEIQADMPEYETYLPMFGDAGNELLSRLRTFISSL